MAQLRSHSMFSGYKQDVGSCGKFHHGEDCATACEEGEGKWKWDLNRMLQFTDPTHKIITPSWYLVTVRRRSNKAVASPSFWDRHSPSPSKTQPSGQKERTPTYEQGRRSQKSIMWVVLHNKELFLRRFLLIGEKIKFKDFHFLHSCPTAHIFMMVHQISSTTFPSYSLFCVC